MSESFEPISGDLSLPVSPAPEGSRFGKAHNILVIFLALAAVVWLLSGIYQVNNDQVAIVERLGTYVSGGDGKAILMEGGLHYALPWPIDTVHKISTKQTRTLLVNWFNEPPDADKAYKTELLRRGYGSQYLTAMFDPYLITGDLNVIHMGLSVQYRIDDPEAWLTTIAHSENDSDDVAGVREAIFQEAAKHAMASQLALMSVDQVLFTGRAQLPTTLDAAMEKAMALPSPSDPTGTRKTDMGIHVQSVNVLEVRPPDNVKDNFDAVARAQTEASAGYAKATAIASASVEAARAQKVTLKNDASAYSAQVVGAATAEASQFSQVFAQYQKAPDVTVWNIYMDALKAVTSNATRMIFAQPGQHVTVILDPPQFDVRQVGPPGHGP